MVTLRLVEDRAEILQSLLNFNLGAATNKHLVSKLASRTEHWVYDQQSGQFGPNKFVAYKNMTFAAYQDAINKELLRCSSQRYRRKARHRRSTETIHEEHGACLPVR